MRRSTIATRSPTRRWRRARRRRGTRLRRRRRRVRYVCARRSRATKVVAVDSADRRDAGSSYKSRRSRHAGSRDLSAKAGLDRSLGRAQGADAKLRIPVISGSREGAASRAARSHTIIAYESGGGGGTLYIAMELGQARACRAVRPRAAACGGWSRSRARCVARCARPRARHRHRISNRPNPPREVGEDRTSVKVLDFGSRRSSGQRARCRVSTSDAAFDYMAPSKWSAEYTARANLHARRPALRDDLGRAAVRRSRHPRRAAVVICRRRRRRLEMSDAPRALDAIVGAASSRTPAALRDVGLAADLDHMLDGSSRRSRRMGAQRARPPTSRSQRDPDDSTWIDDAPSAPGPALAGPSRHAPSDPEARR